MQPFQMAGSLDIYPASTCVRVVASGGCAAPTLAAERTVPSLDPEEACQQAIDAGLVVHRAHPLNCETSIPGARSAASSCRTPASTSAITSNPQPRPSDLPARGRRPRRSAAEPLHPRPPEHAVADAGRHAGVRRQRPHAVRSAHRGREVGAGRRQHGGVDRRAAGRRSWIAPVCGPVRERCCSAAPTAERSTAVRNPFASSAVSGSTTLACGDVLLAYAMNGEPLPIQHGYPLRLIVPRWYAVASVKWLTEIELIDRPFDGPLPERQVLVRVDARRSARPRAGDAAAGAGADHRTSARHRGPRGRTGHPRCRLVRRRADRARRGERRRRRLAGGASRQRAQSSQLAVVGADHARGEVERSRAPRARDRPCRRVQPERAEWNRLGYGNNAIQEVPIRVS